MNVIDIDREKKSDDSSVSRDKPHESDKMNDESNEESYEAYRTQSLPEEYTPYKETGQAIELVYDRYDSDYEADQVADQGLHVKIPENYFKILEEGKNVGKFIFRRNVKIPENEPRKRKNPGKFFRK